MNASDTTRRWGGALAGFVALLAIRGVPRMLISSIVARLEIGMAPLALVLLVEDRAGSLAAGGTAAGGFALAAGVAAPLVGALVDRAGLGRVLLAVTVMHGALLSVLVAVAAVPDPAVWLLVLISILAGAVVPPIGACTRVLWAGLASSGRDLDAGYALDTMAQQLSLALGPLLAAVAVAAAGPSAALLASAVLTLAGTTALTAPDWIRHWRGRRLRESGAPRPRGLLALLASALLFGAGAGAVEVALTGVAVVRGSGSAAGLLLGSLALGSLCGGLLYGARAWRLSLAPRYAAMLAASALLTLPLVLAGAISDTSVLAFLCGAAVTPALSCQTALTGALAGPVQSAELFSWVTAAFVTGFAGGLSAGGVVVEAASPSGGFAFAASMTALASAIAAVNAVRVARVLAR